MVRGLDTGWTWKVNNMPTLSEFPAEVHNQLQQKQTDRQEQQQAEQPEKKKTVCLSVCLCDGLSKEQSKVSPGAAQHLHAAPAWEKVKGDVMKLGWVRQDVAEALADNTSVVLFLAYK